jgi:hypothetical protein
MGWTGKISGAVIGFFIGGVYGAVAGGIVGQVYDKRADRKKYFYDNFQFYCPHCQSLNVIIPGYSAYTCYNCSNLFSIVYCPFCKNVMSVVPGYYDYECCYCNKHFTFDNWENNNNGAYDYGNENRSDTFEESQYDKYLKILGCNRGDSKEFVKKRYRTLAKEFHPDKISGKNLSSEFIEFANIKFKEINEAYEYLNKNML